MSRGIANKLINEREVKNDKVDDIVLTKVRDPRSEYLYKLFVQMVREKYNIKLNDLKSGL